MTNKKTALFNSLYKRAHKGSKFWRILYSLYSHYFGCDIPASTVIGEGFEIFHSAHGSVISPRTIIGRNVSLRQNTTIGAKGFSGAEKAPVIEDYVTIGPNVCMIEDITIGKGTTIDASTVVVKNVDPGATVVGNPAKNINKAGGYIRRNLIIRWILDVRKKIYNKRADKLRAPFIPDVIKVVGKDTTIISSNCFAGRIMQDVGMEYNSPTVGLYFWAEDYVEFLSHLEHYLTKGKIEFVEHSKYTLGNQRRENWSHWYPIGVLDHKVEIHFLHYHTEEEAAEKWYRRAARVNINNLLIIGMEQNLCTEQCIRDFDQLPFERKIFFSSKDIPECQSCAYLPEFAVKGEVGDPYLKGDIFYKKLIDSLSE